MIENVEKKYIDILKKLSIEKRKKKRKKKKKKEKKKVKKRKEKKEKKTHVPDP